jgi:endo-1,4-beta-D-glucanase Y
MEQDVRDAYNRYRTHLRTNGTFSWINAQGTGVSAGAATISEAHGYGMMIFALMAGTNGDERAIFDRMNNLRRAMPSTGNSGLMSWTAFPGTNNGINTNNRSANATDGCLDMAYALLLADTQWGSNPASGHAQNYLQQAQELIGAIRAANMHQDIHRTTLGDWQRGGSGLQEARTTTTRTSDWRPAHFRAFARATNQQFWTDAANMVYTMLARTQVSNATTGLMPDFVIGNPARAVSQANAGPESLVTGEHNQWNYSMNACRVPWQLAIDYAHHGTAAAKTQLTRITNTVNSLSGGNRQPNNINAGNALTLGGQRVGSGNWTGMSWMGPFASAMAAAGDIQFLNNTFSVLATTTNAPVYDLAIQLLNMILLTGNHWAPGSQGTVIPPTHVGGDTIQFTRRAWSVNNEGAPSEHGSTATITTNNIESGVLAFNFNTTPSDWQNDINPWASIGSYFDVDELRNLTMIEVTYTSSRATRITLFGTSGQGGCGYTFELPAAATSRRVTIAASGFAQPDWCNQVAFNDGNIEGIMIEAIPVEGQSAATTVNITSLISVTNGTMPTAISQNRPSNAVRAVSGGMTITRDAINLNIPSERAVLVQIADVRGRVLFSQDINLNAAGIGALGIPASIQRNQALIVNVKGRNGFNASRKMLLTR